jgi:Ca-activated chloride channel family protein
MHFARQIYLNLLWGMPILTLIFIWSFFNRRRRLRRLVSPSLAAKLTEEFSLNKAILRALLLIGCLAFGILALTRPQWGTRLETVRRRGVDIIAALDTSYSMNTEDVAPTRLIKARSEIHTLAGRLKDDRLGLVAFAGAAMVQCPLTLDYGAISLFLDIADTETIPEPGTSLAAAIETATAAFIARETKYKVLLLFTDGEDLEGQVDTAVAKAKEAGVIVYAVGIGTPEGKPIPVRDAKGDIVEYRRGPDGQVVISSLDERSLARIAEGTGGRYFRATTAESEIDDILADLSKLEKKELASRLLLNYEDQFQYPLAVACICLCLEAWLSERRRPGKKWRARISAS